MMDPMTLEELVDMLTVILMRATAVYSTAPTGKVTKIKSPSISFIDGEFRIVGDTRDSPIPRDSSFEIPCGTSEVSVTHLEVDCGAHDFAAFSIPGITKVMVKSTNSDNRPNVSVGYTL